MGFKVIRLALTYLSLTIATNFMTQIYMEKVLVNNETPPPLLNFVWMFLFIDLLVNVLFTLVILLMENFNIFGDDGGSHQILSAYLLDYGASLVLLTLFSTIVGNTMYNKKYFLYKDDGLRAIRALSEIIFNMAIIVHILPYGLVVKMLMGGGAATLAQASPPVAASAPPASFSSVPPPPPPMAAPAAPAATGL